MLPSFALLSLIVIAPTSSTPMWAPAEDSPRKQVIYVDGAPTILLDGGEVADAVGPARTIDESSPMVVRRAVDPAFLQSDAAKEWLHQEVVLYAADGSRCEAKVASLALYGWFNFVDGDADGFSPMEVWERSKGSGGVYLTAELQGDACQGAVVAQLAAEPAHVAATPRAASEVWRDIAMRALPQVEAFQKIQNEFIYSNPRSYDDEDAVVVAATTLWDDAPRVQQVEVDGRAFLLLTMARDGSCGDFGGQLVVAWEIVQQPGIAHVRLRYAQAGEAAPAFAFADHGTGTVRFEALREFYAPSDYDGCGC